MGDIDLDGSLDLIYSTRGTLHAVNNKGDYLPGWPVYDDRFSKSMLADIDADGYPEIINLMKDQNRHAEVAVWEYNGHRNHKYTKKTEQLAFWFYGAPAIADLDEDGIMELVYNSQGNHDGINDEMKCSGSINIWELAESKGATNHPWPTVWRDPAKTQRFVLTHPQDFQPRIQIPHAPSNEQWVTEMVVANPSDENAPILLKASDDDGQIQAKRQVIMAPKEMYRKRDVRGFFGSYFDQDVSRMAVDTLTQPADLLAWQLTYTRPGSLSSGFALKGNYLMERVSLDHIPRDPWWLGIAMQNGSNKEIDLYF